MKWSVAVVACVTMICVATIELYALHMGHDGAMVISSIAAIVGVGSGAVGYRIAKGS